MQIEVLDRCPYLVLIHHDLSLLAGLLLHLFPSPLSMILEAEAFQGGTTDDFQLW